jgi:hypothetical protein
MLVNPDPFEIKNYAFSENKTCSGNEKDSARTELKSYFSNIQYARWRKRSSVLP